MKHRHAMLPLQAHYQSLLRPSQTEITQRSHSSSAPFSADDSRAKSLALPLAQLTLPHMSALPPHTNETYRTPPHSSPPNTAPNWIHTPTHAVSANTYISSMRHQNMSTSLLFTRHFLPSKDAPSSVAPLPTMTQRPDPPASWSSTKLSIFPTWRTTSYPPCNSE
jgi:hypothetical protein